jgi:hypothetical protein
LELPKDLVAEIEGRLRSQKVNVHVVTRRAGRCVRKCTLRHQP